ncbi:uncharacterized protein TNCV_2523711 [Trichonephila clavipes]|nr:uncharacterized protein TNCV_2523711 [Trichonephila clavipes]
MGKTLENTNPILKECNLHASDRIREGGCSVRGIAERLGRNIFNVPEFREQWLVDGTFSRRLCSGWPRGTIERKDRHIWPTAVAHCTASAAEI